MKSKEPRLIREHKAGSLLVSLSAVVAGILAGCVLLLIIGHNPVQAIRDIVYGAFSGRRRIGQTIAVATPLIFVGLSVGFAYKAGLFNIGGSGQMLVGGCVASLWAYYGSDIPRPLYLCIIVVTGMLAGAVWGGISGFLKAKFKVHEVVSSIMLNWSALWFIYEIIPAFIPDPNVNSRSATIPNELTLRTEILSQFFPRSYINWGIVYAVIAIVVIKIILDKTTLGFQLKAVGANRDCAEYAGIKVDRNIVVSMVIAGALAGLAGVTYYAGYSNMIYRNSMPSEGFDGIAVALLGNSNPIGIFFSALFFSILKAGKGSLSASSGIPPEIADTIIATIIYFTATSVLFRNLWNRLFHSVYERRLGKRAAVNGSEGGEK